jgi:hypothetical protein
VELPPPRDEVGELARVEEEEVRVSPGDRDDPAKEGQRERRFLEVGNAVPVGDASVSSLLNLPRDLRRMPSRGSEIPISAQRAEWARNAAATVKRTFLQTPTSAPAQGEVLPVPAGLPASKAPGICKSCSRTANHASGASGRFPAIL